MNESSWLWVETSVQIGFMVTRRACLLPIATANYNRVLSEYTVVEDVRPMCSLRNKKHNRIFLLKIHLPKRRLNDIKCVAQEMFIFY